MFELETPNYEEGREVVLDKPKTTEEIMFNNPPFSSAQRVDEPLDEGYMQRASTMAYNSYEVAVTGSAMIIEKTGDVLGYVGSSL